jgi:mannose-6-phosphate isomerase class I
LEACLDVFDYRGYPVAEARERFQQKPRTLRQTDAFAEEEIISAPWHEFFRLHRLRGTGDADWAGNELMLLIMITGEGELIAESETRRVRAGETWLLPGVAKSWRWQNISGDWELLLAKLPVTTKSTVT